MVNVYISYLKSYGVFFSGNEVYWKTRWEDNNRTLVCYKEGTLGENVCGNKCDPTSAWTGLWRDGASYDAGKPENGLTGQISWQNTSGAIQVPASYKNLRFWRSTSIVSLGTGAVATFPNGTLGHESDFEQYPGNYPLGRITLSSTSVLGQTHKLSLYRHASGALVFGAGTIQWSWGLDDKHDLGNLAPSQDMQQATVNLLADMGVQPATLMAGLTAVTQSTDTQAPASTITFPAHNGTVNAHHLVTITGTSNPNGGVLAGILVSVDGGTTWNEATGTTSWTYSWTPTVTGAASIRVRGFDDSGNIEASGATGSANNINVNVQNIFSPPLPPSEGPGGPILVISNSTNPFSRFPVEILRAEGLNEFAAADISTITSAASLNAYDVVVLGEMSLTSDKVTLLTNWVNAGGTLIAFRPDAQLNGLMGLTATSGTLADKYLLVNTASGPGLGIVNQTMQFHGTADLHTLTGGAISLATLYSNATTATTNPAISSRTSGSGKAIAFMYDLARSIVYTRQGNPAQAGTETDGQTPIRSDDLFFPDYLDMNKVAIPQADEQQRLLANIIIQSNLAKKPLPRFWYMPSGHKAAIVYTLDDHSTPTGTKDIFDKMNAQSPAGGTVANWQKYRATSWFYGDVPLTNSLAAAYNAQGFELGVHVQNNCENFTSFANLDASYAPQMLAFQVTYPSLPPQTTHRFHCIVWSDWLTQAKVELSHGIRYSMDYYYWPPTWIQNRPGLFTGSGMPMRFADLDGSLIDIYQGVTNHVNENGIDYTVGINTLLDNALGSKGYYGFFGTHDDYRDNAFSDAVIAAAQSHNVPIISAKQALNWLDGRNNSSFGSITWNGSQLSFSITAYIAADNLRTMLPLYSSNGHLTAITRNGSGISFTIQTIKGMQYAFFDAPVGINNYVATYTADAAAPVITNVIATPGPDGTTATITWTTNEGSDSKVDYGTVSNNLNLNSSDNSQVTSHSISLTGLTPGTTYFFRVTSKDPLNNSVTEPATGNAPLSFSTPTICASDVLTADFSLGATGANTLASGEGNGAVILKPAMNQDFTLGVLPSGWSEGIFNAGGTTFNSGIVTVNGTHIYTDGTFGPGSSLEFVATFNLGTFQNIGFTSDQAFNSNPWMVIGQGAADGNLYARSSDGAVLNFGAVYLGSSHRYRIVWNPTNFQFFIDGSTTPIATLNVTIASNMYINISDVFNTDGALSVDWIRITPYAASGTFTSRVFDAGSSKTWGSANWNTDLPAGTNVVISARTGNTLVPDGTWTAFATIASSGNLVGATSRYIQYQAVLSTSDTKYTPVLKDVSINCGAPIGLPVVTTQPVSQTICSGNNVSFTSAAIGSPTPLVQWQVSTNNGTSWSNISGAVNATYTFATVAGDNGKQYRAVWSNSAGSANSNAAILTVNVTPAVPTVTVTNNCGNSLLTVTNVTGTLLWSNSATTSSITVTNAATYTVTQSANGCTSASGSGTSAPKTIPSAPAVTVTNNCGSSLLTASSFTGSLLWSNGATTTSITVTDAATYTVTQTVNGCASATGSGTSAPKVIPPAPTVTVTNNCGSSLLTATNFTGSLLWSNGATTNSITVTNSATYTVTQTVNACISPAGSGTSAPKVIPSAPTVTVQNNCGNSVLTAGNFTGSLLWSNGSTANSITVTNAATYTVTQTINACVSAAGSGTSAPLAVPTAPTVGVVDNCGNSVLTASNFTGSLLWSNSATTSSITVTNSATYTVTQTAANGCVSPAGTGVSAPKVVPVAPTVGVANNCGNSVLTASNFTGSLLWSNSATTSAITVTNAATYTVTQTTANGCVSPAGSGTSAPKTIPLAPTLGVADNCGNSVLTASNFTGSLLWSNGATSPSITVNNSSTYTVTQTVNACVSPAASATSAPKAVPSSPSVSVANNCGNSVLTASNFTGSLLWSNGITTPTNMVSNAATYTVTQTAANGCTSAPAAISSNPNSIPTPPIITPRSATTFCQGGSVILTSNAKTRNLWNTGATTQSIVVSSSGTYTVTYTNNDGCSTISIPVTVTVNPIPAAPSIAVQSNCGNSVLTANNSTGSLHWSNGATTSSITVLNIAAYNVTQTVNGCISPAASAISAPKPIPAAPTIAVSDNCGNSVLTAGAFAGTLVWSNTASTPAITVTDAATYTLAQTINGCTSPSASAVSAPKTIPTAPSVSVANDCGNSILTASDYTGSLLWSVGAQTTPVITVNTAGTYSVTQTTANGCTSIAGSATATPKNIPSSPLVSVLNQCGSSVLTASNYGGLLNWSLGNFTNQSITVTDPGTYSVTQTMPNGCTSNPATALAAPFAFPSAPTITAGGPTTICTGGSVVLTSSEANGNIWSTGATTQSITVSAAGSYTVSFVNSNGCASGTSLPTTVAVNVPTASTTNLTICSNELPYSWNNSSFIGAGTYLVHLTNVAGCDSAATLILSVNPIKTSTTNVTICSNQLPYNWNGNDYTQAGDYTVTGFTTTAGCDSSATLHLVVNQTSTSTTTVSACNNYFWNDLNYTESGTYTKLFPGGNAGGCDSTATLVLVIRHSSTSTTPVTACNSYLWNGTTYTVSGTYNKLFASGNAVGCDSTATLVLTINHSSTSSQSVTACDNYSWNGVTYTASGTYTKLFTAGNAVGCDSTATLILTIKHSTSSTETITACDSYTRNGTTYTESGLFTRVFQGGNAVGCDSTSILIITINHSSTSSQTVSACDSYTWNGITYTASGTYTKLFPGGNAVGCDSTATLILTINLTVPVSVTIASSDADNTVCAGTSVTFTATPVNGGTTPAYQWYNGVTPINGETGSTYTTIPVNGDAIHVVVTSNAPCTSGNPATSNVITTTVNAVLPVSVTIVSDDADNTICAGTSVTFTATPTNGGTTPHYQWKLNGNNVGADQATYTTTGLNHNDAVSVVLTSSETCASGSPATSDPITTTVNANLPVSVSIAANTGSAICAGTNVTFTATPINGGATPSYQWKLNGANVGADQATYTATGLVNNDVVTVVLTSSASPCATGSPATSDPITMTVSANLPVSVSIAAAPGNVVCAGTSVTFTATPVNGGATPSYQWLVNDLPVGGNQATYTTSGLATGDVVKVVLTSSATPCATGSPATSDPITMTVNAVLPVSVTIASSDADNTICAGTSVTFTATPTNGGTTPSYQWKLNGANVGANQATYTTSTLASGDQVSVVLTSSETCASGSPATSDPITTTVNANLPVSVSIACQLRVM